jgi:outer membrane protein assembly factor BamB
MCSPELTRPRARGLLVAVVTVCVFGVSQSAFPLSTGATLACTVRQLPAHCLAFRAQRKNWPKFHFDLANTGYNPYETQVGVGNVSSLMMAWTYRAGSVHGTPALWRGILYVAGGTSHVPVATVASALDATTGSVIWSRKIPHSDGTLAGVSYKAGALYVGTSDYVLHSLDASTGAERWQFLVGGIPTDAVVWGGLVFVGKNSGSLYALDAATGAEVWASDLFGGVGVEAPALANGTLYLGGYDDKVHALDASTGSTIWTFRTGGRTVYASPAVYGDLVYAPSDDGYLYALDATTGVLVWKRSLGQQLSNSTSPAVADGVVYASWAGVVQALDATDGTPLWSAPIAQITGSPVVANGVLYVTGNIDATFNALDAATGVLLWTVKGTKDFADPIIANGMVYVGSIDRNLYAFKLPG